MDARKEMNSESCGGPNLAKRTKWQDDWNGVGEVMECALRMAVKKQVTSTVGFRRVLE